LNCNFDIHCKNDNGVLQQQLQELTNKQSMSIDFQKKQFQDLNSNPEIMTSQDLNNLELDMQCLMDRPAVCTIFSLSQVRELPPAEITADLLQFQVA